MCRKKIPFDLLVKENATSLGREQFRHFFSRIDPVLARAKGDFRIEALLVNPVKGTENPTEQEIGEPGFEFQQTFFGACKNVKVKIWKYNFVALWTFFGDVKVLNGIMNFVEKQSVLDLFGNICLNLV